MLLVNVYSLKAFLKIQKCWTKVVEEKIMVGHNKYEPTDGQFLLIKISETGLGSLSISNASNVFFDYAKCV